jgi:hypothetical protein
VYLQRIIVHLVGSINKAMPSVTCDHEIRNSRAPRETGHNPISLVVGVGDGVYVREVD